MNQDNILSEELLDRITNHLFIHSSFMSSPGLYHGKMGVVIFFAHLSRYTENAIYDDFSSDLLEEICKNLHNQLPVDFENGLCGIGWGVEYLVQNGFMQGDTDDILSDIDKRIMEYDPRRVRTSGIQKGLEGISFYVKTRLSSPCRNQAIPPFDNLYLSDWREIFGNLLIPNNYQILSSIFRKTPVGNDITSWRLGLENGCAGIGLRILHHKFKGDRK